MQLSATNTIGMNKVPQVTLIFWIIKIMSTTVGETGADLLIFQLHYGLALTSALMGMLLIVALLVQLRSDRYVPAVYWLAVVLVSVVGTLVTDNLTDNLEVPLEMSTGVFAVALVGVLALWQRLEKTLSIEHIDTRRRELLYWTAILLTFALGTAAGDLASERWELGYLPAALLFGAAIGLAVIARVRFETNPVLVFWVAYILTRPLGAALADYLAQPKTAGGLGLGTIDTSLAFLACIVLLVWHLQRQQWRGRAA